jgi:O-antigen/teichoic acid export membrane protein
MRSRRQWARQTTGVRSAGYWSLGSSIVAKVASLLAHVALGFLLAPEEYGVYATALGIALVGAGLRDAGVPTVLVQRGSIDRDWPAAKRLATSFNLLAALVVGALAALPGLAFETRVLVLLTAASIPLGTAASLYRARARAALQMRGVASVAAFSVAVHQALVVGFALAGFGALSFGLPLLVVPLIEWAVLRRLAGSPQPVVTNTSPRDLLRASRWMMATAVATAFVQRVDYLVLSMLVDVRTLGVYFFAFQITVAIQGLISTSVNKAFMPYLARTPSKEATASLFSVGSTLIATAGGVLFGGIIAAAPASIELLWGGRWETATVPVQLLAAAAAVRLFGPLAETLFEARGTWRWRAGLTWVEAVGLALGALVGGLTGNITGIAVSIMIAQCLHGIVSCGLVDRSLRSGAAPGVWRGFLLPLVPPVLIGALWAPNAWPSLGSGAATVTALTWTAAGFLASVLCWTALLAFMDGTYRAALRQAVPSKETAVPVTSPARR